MGKYRKKPVVVEAEQWFPEMCYHNEDVVSQAKLERWGVPEKTKCSNCDTPLEVHAKCPTLEGYHIVCPGDFIIKGIQGEFYPCKPDIFEATYEKVD